MSAGAASRLLARRVAEGLRLGMEAHFLLAYFLEQSSACARRGAPLPEEMDTICVRWCRVLANMADRLDADGDKPLAQDVLDWGAKVFFLIDPDGIAPEEVIALGEATAVFERLTPPGAGA
jgi:hypothetical protein